MKVEMMHPDALVPYARNPRHNDNAVDAVAATGETFDAVAARVPPCPA